MEKVILDIDVRVEQVIRYKEDSNWGMFACVPANFEDYDKVTLNKYGNMSVVGVAHLLDVNSIYKLKAEVTQSKDWGTQYKIIRIRQEMPVTPEQQKEYVGSFVTPLQLQAIYNVYEGQDVIQLFKDDTFDHSLVYGFGEFTYDRVRRKLLNNLELIELINEFPMLDMRVLTKLLREFSSATLLAEKLKENPYILTTIRGFGFKTADEIALELGIPKDSPFRIHAAIRYKIGEIEANGDTYIKESKLISGSYELLKLKKTLIKAELPQVEGIVKIGDRYALKNTFQMEVEVAEMLKGMKEKPTIVDFDPNEFIAKQEYKHKIKLTDQQRSFFENFKTSSVSFLVGYAGCGKSMLQKLLIELLEEKFMTYRLLAPTGKAGKVLSKYTNREASTIHRAVGMGKNEEEFAEINIYEDVVIVDESSMCGISLARTLLTKLKNPRVRILFIGDSFQIPSVDKGNFLFDCQESGVFPVTKLDIVFRQKEGGILDLVTKVRLGEKFIEDDFIGVQRFGKNCLLVATPQNKMEKGYRHYYERMIKTYGMDGVLVLSPTKKGKLGTFAVNRTLQEIVNPLSEEDQDVQIAQIKDNEEMFFRLGDNVINTVNSYKMKDVDDQDVEVMNGETGRITLIDVINRNLHIDYEGVVVVTLSGDLEKILHAYCITMHKSQGSSCRSIISISDRAHTHQLNANLLYTAWTRPEEFLVILCQPDVINQAMKKIENLRRNTFLCEILKEEIEYSKHIKVAS